MLSAQQTVEMRFIDETLDHLRATNPGAMVNAVLTMTRAIRSPEELHALDVETPRGLEVLRERVAVARWTRELVDFASTADPDYDEIKRRAHRLFALVLAQVDAEKDLAQARELSVMKTRVTRSVDAQPPAPAAQRYRIEEKIGEGGMAEIYRAKMQQPDGQHVDVAMKRLKPDLQINHEFRQMFADEANIATRMRHPNIVRVYDTGELDGSLFSEPKLRPQVSMEIEIVEEPRRRAVADMSELPTVLDSMSVEEVARAIVARCEELPIAAMAPRVQLTPVEVEEVPNELAPRLGFFARLRALFARLLRFRFRI